MSSAYRDVSRRSHLEVAACSRFEHSAAASPAGLENGDDAHGDGADQHEEALSERSGAGTQPSGDRSAHALGVETSHTFGAPP